MEEAALDLLREWFAKGEIRADLENAQRAEGWCVVTVERVHGDVAVYKFDHAAAAIEYAEATKLAMNDDVSSDVAEWSVKVVPLLPP